MIASNRKPGLNGKNPAQAALISMAWSLAVIGAGPGVAAQTGAEPAGIVEVSAPAGPLSQSLMIIADVYGVTVVGPDSFVAGKQAPAVSGAMTVEEALERALAQAGLVARRSGAASFAIEPPTVRERAAQLTSDEIIVRGRAQNLYRVRETDTAKLPPDPLDATQIITSINNELIEDQGARDSQDLYRNIAGVSFFTYAGVTARGFRQEEIFFDGLRGNPYIGLTVPQLFNIERVDFLKGPAGMLYGCGDPGGLFNYRTKRPSQEFSAELRGIYGTEARIGGSFEITGALPVDGAAGRIGVFVEDRNTPRDNTASRIASYDVGFSADLPFATLTLQATRYEQYLDGNRLRGVPVGDDGDFLADRRWNHNEETDFLDLRSDNIQAILDGEIGSEISWYAIARYTEITQSQEFHEPEALFDTDGDDDLVGRSFATSSTNSVSSRLART